MRDVPIGQADYTVFVKILLTTGAPATGLTNASIDLAYTRVETDNDVTTADVTPAALALLTDPHTDWGFIEVSATDHPGLYRLDIADAVFATGAWESVVTITDASGTDFYAVDIGFRLIDANLGSLTVTERQHLADTVLKRAMGSADNSNAESGGAVAARSLLNAIRFLRNKWSPSGNDIIITKEDDTTEAWRTTVTKDANADPVVSSDPTT